MTAPEDQNGLREALARGWNPRCEMKGPRGSCRTPDGCHCREIAALNASFRAAEAEITRLKEGMEARERALELALRFVDLAAGEGLSFDADGSRPAMDAADVCFAVAEALGIEDLDSDAYRALVACPALATLSPKEQP